MESRIRRHRWTAALAVLAAVGVTTFAQGAEPTPDERQSGWLDGHVYELFVKTPKGPADAPSDARADEAIYMIAAVDEKAPQDNGGTFPIPPGAPGFPGNITIPVHDIVLPKAISGESPADCFGSYVVAGPNASAETVKTRQDPNGSDKQLAYAADVGGQMRQLTDQDTVRKAVDAGLLKLDDSLGYGGQCWTGLRLSERGDEAAPPAPTAKPKKKAKCKQKGKPAKSKKAKAKKRKCKRPKRPRPSAPPASPPAKKWSTELTLKELTTQFYFGEQVVYPKPPGRGAGNLLFSSGDLYNGDRKVGRNVGSCVTAQDTLTTVTNSEGPGIGTPSPTPDAPANLVAHCSYDITLDGGTLIVQGPFNQTKFEGDCASKATEQFCSGSTETLAVLGGTGDYVGAAGQAHFTQVEYPDVVRIVVQLK